VQSELRPFLYHRRGQRWSGTLEKLVNEDDSFLICRDDPRTLSTTAFETKVIDGKRVPTDTFPHGYLNKLEEGLSGLSVLEIRPLINWMRPFSLPGTRPDESEWKLEATGVPIEGAACVVVTRRHRVSGSDERLWVDPAQKYVIRRATHSKVNVTWCAYDAWFTRNQSGIMVPTRWRMSIYSANGSPDGFYDCAVEHITLNTLRSAEQLRLDFPPGTLLSDQRKGKVYLLGPDGKRRMLKPGERRRGYHALVASERTFLGNATMWFMVIGAVIACVTIAFVIRRRFVSADV
jgi:hypothetical protein